MSGLGALALASLLQEEAAAAPAGGMSKPAETYAGALKTLQYAPKAKRVIYLFQSGGPSHLDLFDYKPGLEKQFGIDLPPSVRMGQRITGMTSGQKTLPVAPSMFKFAQHGKSGIWLSELLPHTAKIVDELCIVKSMHTEAINHDPAVTVCQTGAEQPGRPTMGAWLSYGLGSENRDMPAFVVLTSGQEGQNLHTRYWGSGFLPSVHQGVQFRAKGDPVLFLSNPAGISTAGRRRILDSIRELNQDRFQAVGDPEIATRIEQYELAFRMQASVPDLMDLSKEPQSILDLYGPEVKKPGSFAYNCLLARRMAERDVRFVQLYQRDWDHHGGLPGGIRHQCQQTDQPSAALIHDLKQRGLLEDTLVIWGGEFGRTVYSQGELKRDNYGRDHHGRCYSLWLAGGGIKPGTVYGETDDFGWNITRDPVTLHDFHATLLYLLGIEHTKFLYRFQGRDYRLTDIAGEVVKGLLA
ncbi:MAG TPA: DUF1501 domain-containing protein [Armatimonadota bacterium]|nr:DUF1501 domain-containing protein [Armatimonadota bacterium]